MGNRFRLRLLGALAILAVLSACEGVRLPLAGVDVAPSPAAASATASAAATPSASGSSVAVPSREAAGSTLPGTMPDAAGSAAPTSQIATLETLDRNPMPGRDAVALAYQFGRSTEQQRIVRQQPLDVQVGDIESFWLSDLDDNSRYEIDATLVLALDRVLVYVENGVDVDLEALERDTQIFNDQIYPRNRELFGSEWTPGIDGDARLTILNARIPGAGGYFSSGDEVPRSVNRYSNQREMFYINVENAAPGSEAYLSTLAHEFQHMIEYNETDRSATWFNEGMSQLAEQLNGFEDSVQGLGALYLGRPDLQLTDWGSSPGESLRHYGAAYLFVSYLYQQYGQQLDLKRLIEQGAGTRLDSIVDLVDDQNPRIENFGDLYADWAVTNVLDNPAVGDGRFTHAQLPSTVEPQSLDTPLDETVAQFGSDYWQIEANRQEQVIRFDGSDTIGVVGTEPQGTALWWSNRGDDGASTLDRRIDLRNVSAATLEYRLWYDTETGWDYGYVAVSGDDGRTWKALEGRYTTTDDPQGLSQGSGYTGISGGDSPSWVDESIDLSAYAGSEIVLRFMLITDDATNRPGMVIDDLRIPEIGFSDNVDNGDDGWEAGGFVRTDNRFPQQWELRFVRRAGNELSVEPLALDGQNRAELRVAPGESGTLVIMATTPHTTERASYRIEN